MDQNRFTGTAKEAAGRVQDTVGVAAGDAYTQARGKAREVTGQAQSILGQLSDVIEDQPLTAALVCLGIGYIIGRVGRLL
ncbi:MAG: CsbD family protein [Acetobacteraceae bacterium]|nr:CsbD family protein [Acetobacteraceae bacterium]MBV8589233.1 CsbD family protein [Acetobacteraceae bacterium]